MNWNDVRFLLAVAEHGTLHQAAEALRVSHTTVWRRVQSLEKQVGAQLFISDRQGYRLTDVGKEVIHHAQTISDNMDAIDRITTGQSTELKGVIRLTAPAQATNNLLPGILKKFQSRYPQIRFEVLLANTELDLEKREADIAIRGTSNVPDNLIGRCLGKTTWSLFVHKDLYEGDMIDVEDIKNLPIIGHRQVLSSAARWYEHAFEDVPKTVICNDLDSAKGFAEVGMGVTLLPTNEETPMTEIFRLPEQYGAELWLLTHKEMRTSAKIKAFWDFLLEELAEHELIQQALKENP